MVDTYSPDKTRVTNQTEGGNSNSWGQILDASLESLARAVGGYLSKSITGNVTLTLTEAQHAFIRLTGVLAAPATVEIPGFHGGYIIQNATTGGHAVTVRTAAGSGVAVNAGARRWLFCDGTDTISVQTALQADQNLADLANAATARTNLGLGALAILNSVGAGQIDTDAVGAEELAPDAVAWENLVAGIFNQTAVTPALNDKIVGSDTSASGAKAVYTISDILALVPPSSGEANTASNVGTTGANVFKQKTGVNLEFRRIRPGTVTFTRSGNVGTGVIATLASGSLTLTQNADDVEISLNIVYTNIQPSGGGGS